MPGGVKTRGVVENVIALLNDPATPAGIYNPLVDALNDLAGEARVNLHTPEVARVALPLIFGRLDADMDAAPKTAVRKKGVR